MNFKSWPQLLRHFCEVVYLIQNTFSDFARIHFSLRIITHKKNGSLTPVKDDGVEATDTIPEKLLLRLIPSLPKKNEYYIMDTDSFGQVSKGLLLQD